MTTSRQLWYPSARMTTITVMSQGAYQTAGVPTAGSTMLMKAHAGAQLGRKRLQHMMEQTRLPTITRALHPDIRGETSCTMARNIAKETAAGQGLQRTCATCGTNRHFGKGAQLQQQQLQQQQHQPVHFLCVMLKSPAATSIPEEVRKRLRVAEHNELLPPLNTSLANSLMRFHPAPTGLPTAVSELRPKSALMPKSLPSWMNDAPHTEANGSGSGSCAQPRRDDAPVTFERRVRGNAQRALSALAT